MVLMVLVLAFELRSDFAYANNSSMNVPIADQGSAQYHSGQSQFWSAIDRFQSTSHMVQKDFAVRKISRYKQNSKDLHTSSR